MRVPSTHPPSTACCPLGSRPTRRLIPSAGRRKTEQCSPRRRCNVSLITLPHACERELTGKFTRNWPNWIAIVIWLAKNANREKRQTLRNRILLKINVSRDAHTYSSGVKFGLIAILLRASECEWSLVQASPNSSIIWRSAGVSACLDDSFVSTTVKVSLRPTLRCAVESFAQISYNKFIQTRSASMIISRSVKFLHRRSWRTRERHLWIQYW